MSNPNFLRKTAIFPVIAIISLVISLVSNVSTAQADSNLKQGMWEMAYRVYAQSLIRVIWAEVRYGCMETAPAQLTIHVHIIRHDYYPDRYTHVSTIDVASYDGMTYFTEEQHDWDKNIKFGKFIGTHPKPADVNCENYAAIMKDSVGGLDPDAAQIKKVITTNTVLTGSFYDFHIDTAYQKISDRFDIFQIIHGFDTVRPTKIEPATKLDTTTAPQTQALQQLTAKGRARDMQSGLRVADTGRRMTSDRLASLSSGLSITSGATALDRAELDGNPTTLPQSSLSLANQSLDSGIAGVWVSLSNQNALNGANHRGTGNHYQIGSDYAVTPTLTVGISASNTDLSQDWSGNLPSHLSGNILASNIYLDYRPQRLRISAQSGIETGAIDYVRFITLYGFAQSFGITNFHGATCDMRLGYEFGAVNPKAEQGLSLIPSIAVGYRRRHVDAYSERASHEYLALSLPELRQNQAYAGMGIEARMVIRGKDFAALPRLSIMIERENNRLRQNGVTGLVADPSVQFDRQFGGASYRSVAHIAAGMDLIRSGESLVLRADYQGNFAKDEKTSTVAFGLKGGF